MSFVGLLASLVASLAVACRSYVPLIPSVTLGPPDAIVSTSFSGVVAVRELSDERVLIADTRENRLVAADLRSGETRPLGRLGAGPGEIGRVSALLAIGRDSTLMRDPGHQNRWLLVDADLRLTTPPSQSIPLGAPGPFSLLLGADRGGAILAAVVRVDPQVRVQAVDSLILVKVDRSSRRADTVGRVRPPFPPGAYVTASGNVGIPGRHVRMVVDAALRSDEAVLFTDGWIAIVRRAHGRVEWHPPEGPVVSRQSRGLAARWVDAPDRSPVEALRDQAHFGRLIPGAIPAADGRLLILLAASERLRGTRYHVVDRGGAVVSELILEENEQVVSSGAQSLYVVATDHDGLQQIRRYPWP